MKANSTHKSIKSNLNGTNLSEKDERAQIIFNFMPEPVIMINAEGKITEWNPRAETVFGWKKEEVIGQFLHEIIIPERFRERHQKGMKHFLATGEGPVLNKPIELPALRKDGTEFQTELSISPILIEGNYFFIGIIKDISIRKKAEEKLNQFKQFFNLSFDLLCVLTNEGNFKLISPSFLKNLGYSEDEIKVNRFLTYVHPDDQSYALKEIEKLKTGATTIEFLVRFKSKEGAFKYFQWVSAPDPESGDIYAIARDFDERKKKEEQLLQLNLDFEKANLELESFSYSVSHDLRTPLRAINGFTKIIKEKYGSQVDDDGKKMLTIIMNEATRMGQLIDDLLSFSRLGRKELSKTRVDMEKLVNEVVTEVTNIAEVPYRAKIKINDLPFAYCDRSLIKQVFVNFISNALKFSNPKTNPKIEIGAIPKEKSTVYYIKDNGVGFNMDYVDKLFGVFQRLHNAEEFSGTGIGLAIIKKIILRHDGDVWAEGTVDEGATFYFSLPNKKQGKSINH